MQSITEKADDKLCGYEVHPAAQLFPMLSGPEMKELADDIKAHGLIYPIILHEKKILDGRNRLVACEMAKTVPYFRNYSGEHSPTEYVLAANLKRRQLTASQRAALAVKALPILKAEAKERERLSNASKVKLPDSVKGQARDKAAAIANVSPRYVSDAVRIKDKSPQVFQQIAHGEKSISEAKKELRLTPATKAPVAVTLLAELKRLWSKCSKPQQTEFLKWIRSRKSK